MEMIGAARPDDFDAIVAALRAHDPRWRVRLAALVAAARIGGWARGMARALAPGLALVAVTSGMPGAAAAPGLHPAAGHPTPRAPEASPA